MLCHSDYSEILLASFVPQIQYEYYVSNWYVSIEGFALENFIVTKQMETLSLPESRTRHNVFHSFLYNYSKKDADKIYSHIKWIIKLLKQ